MHPRNKYYKNPADFAKLGKKYPEFRKYLLVTSSGYTINFKDPKALRELTVSLLDNDFGLKVELPLDRLIPTVTLRLNYIHWIEDLLMMLPDMCQATGVDIGTGASCIYPLLGVKMNGWKFCASEVDEMSYRFACENVKRNGLEESIQVRLVTSDIVLADLLTDSEHYDFTMCNPPFFADKSEVVGNRSRTSNRPQPSSVCTGTESEIMTSGGEVAFVGRIIDDSLRLGSRIKWYTTMLGKKSSLTSVVAKLKQNNISNIITTEFCQGRTMRWGVAWTFLSDVVTKCPPKNKRRNKALQFLFSANTVCPGETFSNIANIDQLISRISERFKEIFNELKIQVLSESTREAKTTKLHCHATHNTWANQRRKRREAAGKLKSSSKQLSIGHDSGFVTENSLMKSSQTITSSELGHADAIESDENTTNETSQIETDNPLVLTNKISNGELINVEDSRDVGCLNNFSKLNTTRKHQVNPEIKTQETRDNKDAKLPTNTEDKISLLHKKRKTTPDTSERRQKFLKPDDSSKSEMLFLEFVVRLGVKHDDVMSGDLSQMFLQMEWISGQNRNDMYQLFQYFQNRFRS